MRYLIIVAIVAIATVCIGCESPMRPSTVTLKTCYTKPRTYCAPNGARCWQEIDTYVVRGDCPKERID